MDSSFSPSPEARRDPVVQLRERLAALGRTDVPDDVLRSAWDALSGLLNDRVGSRLSAGMSGAEMDEFHALIDAESEDEGAATRWLEDHFPHFRRVAQEEVAAATAVAAEWFVSTYRTRAEVAQDV